MHEGANHSFAHMRSLLWPFGVTIILLSSYGAGYCFDFYLFIFLVPFVALFWLVIALAIAIYCLIRSRWQTSIALVLAAILSRLAAPYVVDAAQWGRFHLSRTEYLAQVAALPGAKGERMAAFEWPSGWEAGSGNSILVYDESDGIASSQPGKVWEARAEKAKLFVMCRGEPLSVRPLGDHFHIVVCYS